MPHIMSQHGKLGLHIGSGAVPPEQCLNGKTVAKIVYPGASSIGTDNMGGTKGFFDPQPKALIGILAPDTSDITAQKGGSRGRVEGRCDPFFQESAHFLERSGGERNHAGFMKLGLVDANQFFRDHDIGKGESNEFTDPQSRGIQEDDGQPKPIGKKRRRGSGFEFTALCQNTMDILRLKNVRQKRSIMLPKIWTVC